MTMTRDGFPNARAVPHATQRTNVDRQARVHVRTAPARRQAGGGDLDDAGNAQAVAGNAPPGTEASKRRSRRRWNCWTRARRR